MHIPRYQQGMIRRIAVIFLLLEGAGAIFWWLCILAVPRWRQPFIASGSPDSTLIMLALPDAVFFIGGSLMSAYGLKHRRNWAWPVLCLHTGAAGYAALLAIMQALLTNSAWLGAILMAPSQVVPLTLAWLLRPALYGGSER